MFNNFKQWKLLYILVFYFKTIYNFRVPKANDGLITEVHTVFCLIKSEKTPIVEVEDNNIIREVFSTIVIFYFLFSFFTDYFLF